MLSRQPHTASYYAATVNEVTNFDRLDTDCSADICVVGAGFTGVATSLTLAERGYSVVLLEANRVGWGASGRNGGQLISGMSGLEKIRRIHGDRIAHLLDDLRWRGNDIIRERISKYAIDCDLKDGFIEVAAKPAQVSDLETYASERSAVPSRHQYELWDRQTTRDMLGTDAYFGGFVCYRDGHLHPLNLCIGEARAAADLGVRIHEHSPVTGIEHGKRPLVRTEHGSVQADAVVLAGNAYSRLEPEHLSNLVFPAGSYIIATEQLPEDVATSINRRDLAVCDVNNIVNYYRLSADRRLLFGGACNYSGRDPASISRFMMPKLLRIYPQLKDVRIEFEWGGKIGIVLNRMPALGRIQDNVYYCQGYSGHGVAPTHLMGEIMADAIAGTMERFDVFADIRHLRVPGSQWFGNQILAIGMLYYKLKDRL